MRCNIIFKLKGPGGVVDAPNKENPVLVNNLEECLKHLSENLPDMSHLGVEIVGVTVKVLKNAREKADG